MNSQDKTIDDFSGLYRFLSNFYKSTIVTADGRTWETSEHLYQAAKANTYDDSEIVRLAKGPGASKRAGRKIEMRHDFDDIKKDIMRTVLFMKFDQNEAIYRELLRIYDVKLIEGNTWHDNIWGICGCGDCLVKHSTNWLGELLMELCIYFMKKNSHLGRPYFGGPAIAIYPFETFMVYER